MIKQIDIYNEVTLIYLIRTIGEIILTSQENLDQNFQFQVLKFLRESCGETGMIGIEACKVMC